jgi:hypothetical protein
MLTRFQNSLQNQVPLKWRPFLLNFYNCHSIEVRNGGIFQKCPVCIFQVWPCAVPQEQMEVSPWNGREFSSWMSVAWQGQNIRTKSLCVQRQWKKDQLARWCKRLAYHRSERPAFSQVLIRQPHFCNPGKSAGLEPGKQLIQSDVIVYSEWDLSCIAVEERNGNSSFLVRDPDAWASWPRRPCRFRSGQDFCQRRTSNWRLFDRLTQRIHVIQLEE